MGKNTEEKNLLVEAVANAIKNGGKKKPPKEMIGFRADPDLKAEAERVFGSTLPRVMEAALREALKHAKKK